MARDEEGSDLYWEMVSDHRGWTKTRSRPHHQRTIGGQAYEALAPGHLRALVMTKFRHDFCYGVLNVYFVILLIKYSINGDASVPLWNWVAINGPVSHRPGLAECHLVLYPFLMDVQLDIDGFSDVVHRLRHICIIFASGVDPQLLRPLNYGLKEVGVGFCGTPDPLDSKICPTRASTVASIHASILSSISFSHLKHFVSYSALPLERLR